MRHALYSHFRLARAFGEQGWRILDAAEAPPVQLHADLGLLMSTSGSTGSPKLVRLSVDNLSANAASICSFMALTANARAITSLPLHYSYGLSVLNSHVVAGGSIVLTDESITTAAFWERFRNHEITGLAGVPTTWRMLRRMRFERMVLPSLKLMTQAGGRLDADEVRWLFDVAQSQRRQLFIMYGQTEATARMSYLPPHWLPGKAGSIGVAIPGGTLDIVDATGASVPNEVEGEIAYAGPNVMLGYAESARELALGRTVDRLLTGDLGYRDSDGLHWVTGRTKRFVKLFGNRFGLDEVEAWLRSQGHEGAAVGRDDLLMIGLVGKTETAATLRDQLAAHYRIHPSAIRVAALSELPRNSAGKVLHATLQSWLDTPADAGSRT
jgi:acyl-coenzyme A synthetase/AMP-(fatty) acid ligase